MSIRAECEVPKSDDIMLFSVEISLYENVHNSMAI